MTHPYGAEDYARSLDHIGAPFAVPEWEGFVLTRPIAGSSRLDATGPYPLTVIAQGADLAAGLDRLKAAGLVSLVMVLDDRLRPTLDALEPRFDTVRRFKTHYLHDRSVGPLVYRKHHRYELKRALARVDVAEIALADHLQAWMELYGQLAVRHGVGGLHAFSTAHHQALASLPGLRAFGAFIEGQLVSAHLFVAHEGYAISHLAASSTKGYGTGAAYAVNDIAVTEMADCQVINFGGGAGLAEDPADGLVRFKSGFSNAVAPSYLCGKILDHAAYQALSSGAADSGFFPIYRGVRRQERSHAHQG